MEGGGGEPARAAGCRGGGCGPHVGLVVGWALRCPDAATQEGEPPEHGAPGAGRSLVPASSCPERF